MHSPSYISKAQNHYNLLLSYKAEKQVLSSLKLEQSEFYYAFLNNTPLFNIGASNSIKEAIKLDKNNYQAISLFLLLSRGLLIDRKPLTSDYSEKSEIQHNLSYFCNNLATTTNNLIMNEVPSDSFSLWTISYILNNLEAIFLGISTQRKSLENLKELLSQFLKYYKNLKDICVNIGISDIEPYFDIKIKIMKNIIYTRSTSSHPNGECPPNAHSDTLR